MKSAHIVAWMFLVVHELAFVPFLCWLWHRLYKRRTYFALKKRNVNWILCYSALLLVFFGVLIPYRIICVMSPKYRNSWHTWLPSIIVGTCAFSVSGWMEVVRLWILLFEMQLSLATAKKHWVTLIDASLREQLMAEPSSEECMRKLPMPHLATDSTYPVSSDTGDNLPQAAAIGNAVQTQLQTIQSDSDLQESSYAVHNFMYLTDPSDDSDAGSVGNDSFVFHGEVLEVGVGETVAPVIATSEAQPNTLDMESIASSNDDDDANDNKDDSQIDWYIEHMDTFGNTRWCLRVAIVLILVHFTLMAGAYVKCYLNHSDSDKTSFYLANRVSAVLYIAISVATIVIYKKTPPVTDFIHLKQEVKGIAVANVTAVLLFYIVTEIRCTMKISMTIGDILQYVVLNALFGFKFWIVHYWVVQRLAADGLLFHVSEVSGTLSHLRLQLAATSRSHSYELPKASATNAAMAESKLLLERVLQSDGGFQAFMEHLTREFAAECLLSAVEFTQFKRVVCSLIPALCAEACNCESLEKCPSRIGNISFARFRFPQYVPKSPIVEMLCSVPMPQTDAETTATAARVCNALYAKYIADYSLLEINISARSRRILDRHLDELFAAPSQRPTAAWLHRLAHVWDDAVTEMFELMAHSSKRFAQRDAFASAQE